MSSAVAEATSALCALLREALERSKGPASAAVVTHVGPADASLCMGAPIVNVALLGAEPDPAHRNRPARGELPLTLTYLISMHGDEAALVPQHLLGAVAAALDRTPVLTLGTATAPETVPIRLLPRAAETWKDGLSGPLALSYAVGPVVVRPADGAHPGGDLS